MRSIGNFGIFHRESVILLSGLTFRFAYVFHLDLKRFNHICSIVECNLNCCNGKNCHMEAIFLVCVQENLTLKDKHARSPKENIQTKYSFQRINQT